MKAFHDHIIFLDIETVSCVSDYSHLNDRLKQQWKKKAGFINRDPNLNEADLFYQKAGIYAEFGKIIVISLGWFFKNESNNVGLQIKTFYEEDENTLLHKFCDYLRKKPNHMTHFCAHNGKEFDYPYLSRRLLIHGIALPNMLNLSGKKPWEVPHLDTLEMWKFGDYKHFTSLELLASIFDIATSKELMDGSMTTSEYYEKNNLKGIAAYCSQDVVTLALLYRKLQGLASIDKQHILLPDIN